MAGRCRYMLLVVLFLLAGSSHLLAQEVEYDYHYYKFYDEDDDGLLFLGDTLPAKLTLMPILARESAYALRQLNFADMGERYSERYILGCIDVDYITARMLSHLKIQSDRDEGFRGELSSSSLHATTNYRLGEDFVSGDALKAELSGKGYLGGISYYGSHKPDYMGVMLKSGWEYRYSARLTSGEDFYIKGIYGDVANMAFNASHKSHRSLLDIILLTSLSERGLRRSSVDEAYTLLGDMDYNPVWGLQNGELRNSRVATMLRPEVIVSWSYRLSVSTTLNLMAHAIYSNEGVTSLAWFNAPTPLPDNYHYLPSYYTLPSDSKPVTDSWLRGDYRYTQIDWDGLYHTNALQSDGRARYIVESRREDSSVGGFVASFSTMLKGVAIDYGVKLNYRHLHRYKVVDDLLGASHISDLDYYMVDDATKDNGMANDLRTPNRRVHEGDIFGYNYALSMLQASLRGGVTWQSGDMGVHASGSVESHHIYRRGYFEKEAFAGAGSYGRSQVVALHPYNLSFVWNYTVDNHMFALSAMAEGDVPDVDDLFLNPEYNNRVVANAGLRHRFGLKLAYANFEHNALRYGAVLFATSICRGSSVVRYYDDSAAIYVDSHVSGISQSGVGVDLRAEVNWNRWLSSNFRAVVSSYRYSDNANVTLYSDSDNRLIARSDVSIMGCHTGSSELALYADLGFNHRGWTIRASLSSTDGGYLSPSYTRYSERILSQANSIEERRLLMTQRNLPTATSLDFTVRKSFEFDARTLSISFAARNLLGDRWVSAGYESNRIRRVTTDYYSRLVHNPDLLTYSYPQTFYISVTYWL